MATTAASNRKLRKRKCLSSVLLGQDVTVTDVSVPAAKKPKPDKDVPDSTAGSDTLSSSSSSSSSSPSHVISHVFRWKGKERFKTVEHLVRDFTTIVQYMNPYDLKSKASETLLSSSIHPRFKSIDTKSFGYLAIRLDQEIQHADHLSRRHVMACVKCLLRTLWRIAGSPNTISNHNNLRAYAIIEFFKDQIGRMSRLRELPSWIFDPVFDQEEYVSVEFDDKSILQLSTDYSYCQRIRCSLPFLLRLIPEPLNGYRIAPFLQFARNESFYRENMHILIDTINSIPATSQRSMIDIPLFLGNFTSQAFDEYNCSEHWEYERFVELVTAVSRFSCPMTWHTYALDPQRDMIIGERVSMQAPTKLTDRVSSEDVKLMQKSQMKYDAKYATPYVTAIDDAIKSSLTSDVFRMVVGYMIPLSDTIFVPWQKTLAPMHADRLVIPPFFRPSDQAIDSPPCYGQIGYFHGTDPTDASPDVFVVVNADAYPRMMTVMVPSVRKAPGITSRVVVARRDRSVVSDPDDVLDEDDDMFHPCDRLPMYYPLVIHQHTGGSVGCLTFPCATDEPIIDRPLSSTFMQQYVIPMSTSHLKQQRDALRVASPHFLI